MVVLGFDFWGVGACFRLLGGYIALGLSSVSYRKVCKIEIVGQPRFSGYMLKVQHQELPMGPTKYDSPPYAPQSKIHKNKVVGDLKYS